MSASREQLIQAIENCPQERIDAAMENPSMMRELLEVCGPEVAASLGSSFGDPVQRAKRPLNGFMAFRTYYLKLFPDTQQKNVSGFLTQLWAKDPHRNKWALIAKVYSFIRDHVGKAKCVLAAFLSVACPMMKTLEPTEYLVTLGWQIGRDNYGNMVLNQDVAVMVENMGLLEDSEHPTTDFDLLTDVLIAGYFADYSQHLQVLMWASQHGIMTPAGAFAGDAVDAVGQQLYDPVPTTAEKAAFVESVRNNACEAAQELFGLEYDAEFFQSRYVHSWEVDDLANFQDVQISIADGPMPLNTLYDFNQFPGNVPQVSELTMDTSIDAGIMEITSAWSVDNITFDRMNQHQAPEDANKTIGDGFFANF
ncbi:mating type protein 1-1-1 [Fusarium langsethiae]|uniref:Mating type protein 1-1-1 n=1 Tax=Fusarium langsethiae TaxID=179993 RepID=A0A0N0DID1_FUSLA|nr:mating type protein 1-1-1 [Fusarium langsethiae]GKU02589.1 unnamed protein product [Fusarium langsethiae]GKU17953.1 unnamed protein product [Fusarium langsethiae]